MPRPGPGPGFHPVKSFFLPRAATPFLPFRPSRSPSFFLLQVSEALPCSRGGRAREMEQFFPSDDVSPTPAASRPVLRCDGHRSPLGFTGEWRSNHQALRPFTFARPLESAVSVGGRSSCLSFGLLPRQRAALGELLDGGRPGTWLPAAIGCACFQCRGDDWKLLDFSPPALLVLADLFAWRGGEIFADAAVPFPARPGPHAATECVRVFLDERGSRRAPPGDGACLGEEGRAASLPAADLEWWAVIFARHFCEPPDEASPGTLSCSLFSGAALAEFALFFAQHGLCQIRGYLGLPPP